MYATPLNPHRIYTYETIYARVSSSSSKLVGKTILEAQNAFDSGIWSKAPPLTRSKVLSKLARMLEARIPELALLETAQTGRTIREMNAQLGRLPEWLSVSSPPPVTTQLTH